MAELLNLSLRENPATLRRKLISAACTRNLIFTQSSWPSSPQRTGTESASLQPPHRFACGSPAPFFPQSWTRSNVLELLHLGQDLIPDPKKAFYHFPAENYSLRFGGADSHPTHTQLRTGPARARGHGLMEPTGPHHLQRAETQSWSHQTGPLNTHFHRNPVRLPAERYYTEKRTACIRGPDST